MLSTYMLLALKYPSGKGIDEKWSVNLLKIYEMQLNLSDEEIRELHPNVAFSKHLIDMN